MMCLLFARERRHNEQTQVRRTCGCARVLRQDINVHYANVQRTKLLACQQKRDGNLMWSFKLGGHFFTSAGLKYSLLSQLPLFQGF
jgi:hypothetical protein